MITENAVLNLKSVQILVFKRTPPSKGDSISVYSDSESDRKSGEVLENTIEDFDNFIELHTKFRDFLILTSCILSDQIKNFL